MNIWTATVLLVSMLMVFLAGCERHTQSRGVVHEARFVNEQAALVGEWVCRQDREARLAAFGLPQVPAILVLDKDGTGTFMFWESEPNELEGFDVNAWKAFDGRLTITGDRTVVYTYTRSGDTLTFTGATRKDDDWSKTGRYTIFRNQAITYDKVK